MPLQKCTLWKTPLMSSPSCLVPRRIIPRGQSVPGYAVLAKMFASDTSPKWIGRQRLGKRRTTTRQQPLQTLHGPFELRITWHKRNGRDHGKMKKNEAFCRKKSPLKPCKYIARIQTLFHFSFRSFRKHWQAREPSEASADREKKEIIIIFLLPPPLPPCAGGQ